MPRIILLRAQQPVLVITTEAHHFSAAFVSKGEYGLNAPSRIGSSVDVIPEKDHHVPFSDFVAQLPEKVEQRCEISVDVSDRHCSHAKTMENQACRSSRRVTFANEPRLATVRSASSAPLGC